MEFTAFLHGTIFLIFAAIALCLHFSRAGQFWAWISVFAALHGTAIWLRLMAEGFAFTALEPIPVLLHVTALFALFEAAVKCRNQFRRWWRVAMIAAAALVTLVLMVATSAAALKIAFLLLGLPGLLRSSWHLAFRAERKTPRIFSHTLAISLAVAILTLSLSPVTGLLPYDWLVNTGLIAMLLSCIFAWLLLQRVQETDLSREREALFLVASAVSPVALLCVTLATWFAANWFMNHEKNLQLQQMEKHSQVLTETLNLRRIAGLTFTEDMGTSQLYQRVCDMLGAYHSVEEHVVFLRMYRMAEGEFLFGPGSYDSRQLSCQSAEAIAFDKQAARKALGEKRIVLEEEILAGIEDVTQYIPLAHPDSGTVFAGLQIRIHSPDVVMAVRGMQMIPLVAAMALVVLTAGLNVALFLRNVPRHRDLCCVRHFEIVFILLTGVTFTFFAAVSAHVFERQNRQVLFLHWSSNKSDQIKSTMFSLHDSLDILGHYMRSGDASGESFTLLARSIANNLGLAFLAWAPQVDDRFAVTAMTSPQHHVMQVGDELQLHPAARLTLSRAWQSGLPHMSAPFSDQSTTTPQWTLIIVPVQQKGVIVAAMDIPAFWQRAMGTQAEDDILVDIHLLSPDLETSIFINTSTDIPHSSTSLQSRYPLFRYGYSWVFVTRPGPLFEQAYPHRAAWVMLLVGLGLTASATGFVTYLTRVNHRVSRMVEARTAELKANLDFQQLLLQVLPVGIAVRNLRTGRYEHHNTAWEEIFSHVSEQQEAQREANLISQIAQACLRSSTVHLPDDAITLSDGSRKFLHTSITPALLDEGQVSSVLICVQDITVRREAEEALKGVLQAQQREIDEAVQTVRQQDQVIFEQVRRHALLSLLINLAHHWRQPLNIAALSIQEIEELFHEGALNDETVNNRVETALGELFKLSETISQFTNLYESPESTRDRYFLFHLCEHAQKFLVPDRAHRLEIANEVAPDLQVLVNRNDVVELFVEFFRNVLEVMQQRHTDHGLVTVHALALEGGSLEITIQDNVGGIDLAVLPQVFDPYVTTSFRTREKGMGLYVCRRIVEDRYQGTIQAENVNGGARFRVVLQGVIC